MIRLSDFRKAVYAHHRTETMRTDPSVDLMEFIASFEATHQAMKPIWMACYGSPLVPDYDQYSRVYSAIVRCAERIKP